MDWVDYGVLQPCLSLCLHPSDTPPVGPYSLAIYLAIPEDIIQAEKIFRDFILPSLPTSLCLTGYHYDNDCSAIVRRSLALILLFDHSLN